jgi:maltose alpha-D-glucosyltransferase/alpha-amylase
MAQQRWFLGKHRSIRDVVIDDIIPMSDSEPEVALVIARVAFTEGDDQRYSVPILRATGQFGATATHLPSQASIARLDDGLVIDAMSVVEGVHAVSRAALVKRTRNGFSGTAQGVPRRVGLRRQAGEAREIHILTGEQSNTSAILPGAMIAKLVRRIEAAPNPDVELPEHLARTGFAHAPGLIATLEVQLKGEDHTASVVVIHDAITNEGDLWTWMADELSREIDTRSSRAAEGGDRTLESSTVAIAGLLGRRTAELHIALATVPPERSHGTATAIAPQGFTLLWQRSLLQSLRSSLQTTQRLLRLNKPKADRADSTDRGDPDRFAQMVSSLCRPPAEVLARFAPLRAAKLTAKRTRVHGDLHLGQVLWTGHDIAFIDFEGEPARPMGERSLQRSPLVDVAGLLRSIDYAGRSAALVATERGMVAETEVGSLDQWRHTWTHTMQQHLVEEYLAHIEPGLVPSDRDDVNLLLELFTLEKALYEIRYELGSRPDWVGWPLQAAVELIEQGPTS